jgi:hypothetical protein
MFEKDCIFIKNETSEYLQKFISLIYNDLFIYTNLKNKLK